MKRSKNGAIVHRMSLGSSGGTGKAGRDGTRWVNFAQNLVLGSENICHLCWTINTHISSFPSQNSSSLTKFGNIYRMTQSELFNTQSFPSSRTYTARRCPEVPSAGVGHWSRDLQGPVAAVRCPYLEHALATRKGGQSLPEGPAAALLGASSWQWEWPEMQSASSTRPTSREQAKAALTRVLTSLHEKRQWTDRTKCERASTTS